MKKAKKYAQDIVDFGWIKIRKTEGEIIDHHLLPYVLKKCPRRTMVSAWEDFICCDKKLPESMYENLRQQIFIPWFLFNWIAEKDEKILSKSYKDHPIALQYLDDNKEKLTDYQIRFIKEICKTHYSFYLVIEVEPEKNLLLKDILLNKEYRVKERIGTHHIERGDIILARVLELDDQAICVGISPCVFPAHYHLQLIDFRDELIMENNGKKLTPSLLRNEFEILVLIEFFDILNCLYTPKIPILKNTDGDLLQICKIQFELICSPKTAFDKLLPLALGYIAKELLNNAKLDKTGEIKSINFPWLKKGNKNHENWENTVMGEIEIKKGILAIEVNSKKRAEKIKNIITKYLGDNAEFKNIKFEKIEHTLKKQSKLLTHGKSKEDIGYSPEEQKLIEEFVKEYWTSWLDKPIPVLHGLTPREATKTKKDKERLDALLLEFEKKSSDKDDFCKPDMVYLRQQLKI